MLARDLFSTRAVWTRAAFVVAVALVAILCRRYPEERLDPRGLESVRVLDRHGELLYERRSEAGGYGRWVALGDVAPALVLATLSAEDAAFRAHPGVDPVGVARAIWLNASERRLAYGGSTVTQQLAGLLEPRPRTLASKLGETADAIRLEAALSKDQILEQYLNRAYYGRNAYGVGAASERFFGKPPAELSLDEAALLAILPRGPTLYEPERHPERALRRRAHVLAKLAERGWVDPEAAARAAQAPIRLAPRSQVLEARHVLDALPAPNGPLQQTTLDLALQRGLEQHLRRHLDSVGEQGAEQGAIVVLDNATGDVLALVGSRDYDEREAGGAMNGALARRPPGSTLKPFVYALALEDRAPESPVLDVPTAWAGFAPRNASLEHRGEVTLAEALGSSLNVPAVRLAHELGVERVRGLLGELGLVDDAGEHGLALALGSAPVRLVDLAAAYATLARDGWHVGWHLTEPGTPPRPARRVIPTAAARRVSAILSDAHARRREFGVETPLELPFPAAAKTGTSKSFCDNFVVGYTPEVTVAVWIGNFDGRPMRGLLAMQGAAPLFRDAMLAAMDGRPRRRFAAAPAGTIAPAATGLAIATPADGAKLAIDPLIPRSRQVLRVRAEAGADVERVRFFVDERAIGESRAPFFADWPIAPGAHRIRVTAHAGGQQIRSQEIQIEVTGGTR